MTIIKFYPLDVSHVPFSTYRNEELEHFEKYVAIRKNSSFDSICTNSEKLLGFLDTEKKQFIYYDNLFSNKSTLDCSNLFEQSNNINSINVKIKLKYFNFQKTYLSETLIEQYEKEYLSLYENTFTEYVDYFKFNDNIYRFFCVVNHNSSNDIDNSVFFDIDNVICSKLEQLLKSMYSNDYITLTVKLDNIIKLSNRDSIEFVGIIESFEYTNNCNKINTNFEIGSQITFSTNHFTDLINKHKSDINIDNSSILFETDDYQLYLINENDYSRNFKAWVYNYFH